MYADHCEKDADGAKGPLGWCDARDLFREIQDIDGHIQCGENAASPLWLLGFGCHGRNPRWLRESGAECRLRRRVRTLIQMSVRLVQPDPFGRENCIRGRAFEGACTDRLITGAGHRPNLCSLPRLIRNALKKRFTYWPLARSVLFLTRPYWLLRRRPISGTPIRRASSILSPILHVGFHANWHYHEQTNDTLMTLGTLHARIAH